MKNEHARALGSIKSDKKTAASRRNGAKGGRPPRHEIPAADLPHRNDSLEGKLHNYVSLVDKYMAAVRKTFRDGEFPAKLDAMKARSAFARARHIEAWRESAGPRVGAVNALTPRYGTVRRALRRENLQAAFAAHDGDLPRFTEYGLPEHVRNVRKQGGAPPPLDSDTLAWIEGRA